MKDLLRVGLILVPFLCTAAVRAQEKRPLSFDDLISVERISEPMISPDGQWVAYTVATPDVAGNRLVRNIWMVSTNGNSEPR